MAKIDGTGDADTLYGTSSADTINGLGGNDVLKGFGGADRLDGGAGIDTAHYSDSTVGVSVNLATGRGFGGSAEGDTLFNIENLFGSAHNDTLTGNGADNRLTGLTGNDILKGAGGSDGLYGDEGDDTLKGGGGADYLHGGAGFDTVSYTESAVGVFVSLLHNVGGFGDAEGDTFVFIENITGTPFGDDLWGHNGVNAINGLDGNDILKGFGAADTLRGENGNDYLDGGTGADTMIGGLGDDVYIVDHVNDVITESNGAGADTVRTSVSYALAPFGGPDVEVFETTDPTGTNPLSLIGNASSQRIVGNDGPNYIHGNGGNDELAGRGGNDTYRMPDSADVVVEGGGQGVDTVTALGTYVLTPGADVEVLRADDYYVPSVNLTANDAGNIVIGGGSDDTLNGRGGNDELFGNDGQDSFLFDTPLDGAFNVDTIPDFIVADDTILLDQTIFSSSLGLGNISSSELVIGPAAQDANDRIIYNSATGALFYDADGVGGNAQVQFARLGTGLALTDLDFFVVA
jgi:Ca2+-binding RTX toxin-like protein